MSLKKMNCDGQKKTLSTNSTNFIAASSFVRGVRSIGYLHRLACSLCYPLFKLRAQSYIYIPHYLAMSSQQLPAHQRIHIF